MNWVEIIIIVILATALGLVMSLWREVRKCITPLSEEEFTLNMRKGQLIDLRKKDAFESGHINGARNIPLGVLRRSIGKIRKDQPVYLYCEKGRTCKRAAFVFKAKGYSNVYQLEGGLQNWSGGLKVKKHRA